MIGRFSEGDRVRLGILRGGEVVRVEGKLRVRFPFASRLLWLDFCVPDEGPNGRIFPNTWNTCVDCGNPTMQPFHCSNCDRRSQREAEAFDRAERRREEREAEANGEPSYGVHVASSVRRHGRTIEQRCARCGAVLTRYVGDVLVGTFPEGALVERGYLGLTPPRDPAKPATCRPVREAVA